VWHSPLIQYYIQPYKKLKRKHRGQHHMTTEGQMTSFELGDPKDFWPPPQARKRQGRILPEGQEELRHDPTNTLGLDLWSLWRVGCEKPMRTGCEQGKMRLNCFHL
jgi:hypothetical protein